MLVFHNPFGNLIQSLFFSVCFLWIYFISLFENQDFSSNVGVQIFHDATESDGPKTGGTCRMQI
jgi:hypothetical protein